jgi:hypothetical protein
MLHLLQKAGELGLDKTLCFRGDLQMLCLQCIGCSEPTFANKSQGHNGISRIPPPPPDSHLSSSWPFKTAIWFVYTYVVRAECGTVLAASPL